MIDNYIADQSPRITMTLSEILANTPPVQTLAQATDVPGANLEWMKTAAYLTGAWFGDLGELGTTGFRDSLFAGYLALGVTCKVSGAIYSWGGAGVGWRAEKQDINNSLWGNKARTNPFGNSTSFPFFDAAWQNYVSGLSDIAISHIGDSTTQGIGSSTYPNTKSYPRFFRECFARDFGSSIDQFMLPPTKIDHNKCWSLGAGWIKAPLQSGNGAVIECPTSANAPSTWVDPDCGVDWDTAEVWVLTANGGGTFTATATGGSGVAGSCSGTATYTITKTTILAAAASRYNSITIQPGASQHLWVVGISVWSSRGAFKKIKFCNLGVGGSAASDWISGIGNINNDETNNQLGSKLTFISLGINGNTDTPEVYAGKIQTIVSRVAAYSDVVLLSPFLCGPARITTNANLDAFAAALNGITGVSKYIDVRPFMKSANIPFWASSDLHPTGVGYKMIGEYIYNVLIGKAP